MTDPAAAPYRLWAEIASDSGDDVDSTPDDLTGDDDATGVGSLSNDGPGEDDTGHVDVEIPGSPSSYDVADRVFIDRNGNGESDEGEPGMPSATVQIFNQASLLVSTQTTTADGGYHFSGLAAGSYRVEARPSAPAYGGVMSRAMTVGPGLAGAADFGFREPAGEASAFSLGSRVWFDDNDNGIEDEGETGVGEVPVRLVAEDGLTVIASTTTNALGDYGFRSLNPGRYRIEVDGPTGTRSSGGAGASSNADDDIDRNDDGIGIERQVQSSIVTLGGATTEPLGEPASSLRDSTPDGNANHTVDFGFVRQAVLRLRKKVNAPTRLRGEMATWTIIVTNATDVAATDVTTCDTIPVSTTMRFAGNGRLNRGRVCWSVDRLAPHEGRLYVLRTRIDRDARIGSTIVNTATAGATNAPTVSARATVRVRDGGRYGRGRDGGTPPRPGVTG